MYTGRSPKVVHQNVYLFAASSRACMHIEFPAAHLQ